MTTDQTIAIAPDADAPLSTIEHEQLTAAEAVIQSGIDTFAKVGEALADIRDGRLYRQTHRSFSDYLAERWPQIGSRRQADRLIVAAEVERDLRPIGLTLASESQARPLADLDPDQRRAAMAGAQAVAGDTPPTAKQVAQAAAVVRPAPRPCEHPGCIRPSVGYFNIEGVGMHLCATHRDEAQRPKPAPADEEIATAAPKSAPPVLTPLTPAPALTPLASLAAGVDLQARKLLAAKRALLAAALDLVEQELGRASAGPLIVIQGAAALEAARLFVASPALGGAASMLSFSARVEDAPPSEVRAVEATPTALPALFDRVLRQVEQIEDRMSADQLEGDEAPSLARCRADLDDLADDVHVPTEAYDALSHRIGAAQARLVELRKEAAA